MHTEQQLREMFDSADALQDGPSKFDRLDAAIRHAEASGFTTLAFQFRHMAVQSFTFGGDDRRAFLAFSQNLAAYDRDPAIGGNGMEHNILWQFKWIVNGLPDFPDVPLDRTYAVLDDMQRRYLRSGASLHAVHQSRWQIALHVGDFDEAARSYHDMLTAKRDSLSNCSTCVPSAQTRYFGWLGQWQEAVDAGEPVRNRGCARQPQWVRAYLMLPYLHVGKTVDAAEMHRNSYRQMRTERASLGGIGLHLIFLAASGNEARGLEVLEQHREWLDNPPSPHDALSFMAAAVAVLNLVSGNGFGDADVRGSTVDTLRDEYAGAARTLAARFDSRNGTTHQSELAEQWMATETLNGHVSLSVLASTHTRKRKIVALQERIAEHTRSGNLPAAALARLEAAIAMRNNKNREEAFAAAEEALLALERAELTADAWRARHLLWDLYRADYQYRDAALGLVDQLLTATLPARLPSRAQLTEQGAELVHDPARYLAAADLYRDDGDTVAELRCIRLAVNAAGAPPQEWFERADALDHPDDGSGSQEEWRTERELFELVASRELLRQGRAADALSRAEAARQLSTDGDVDEAMLLAGRALLALGRPAEAEERLRVLIAAGQWVRYETALLVRALQAQGRTEDALALISANEIEDWELEEADAE